MTLGNTPRQRTVLRLERGKSYALTITFQNPDGSEFDMTGSLVRMTAKAMRHLGDQIVIQMDAIDRAPERPGEFQFPLQASDTDLEPAEYPFDVTWISANGYSTPVVKGSILIGDNTDPDVANTYPTADTLDELVVVIGSGNDIIVQVEQADARKGDQGDIGPPGGLYIQDVEPQESDPLVFTPLWVDTDDDPLPVIHIADTGLSEGQLLWIDTSDPGQAVL